MYLKEQLTALLLSNERLIDSVRSLQSERVCSFPLNLLTRHQMIQCNSCIEWSYYYGTSIKLITNELYSAIMSNSLLFISIYVKYIYITSSIKITLFHFLSLCCVSILLLGLTCVTELNFKILVSNYLFSRFYISFLGFKKKLAIIKRLSKDVRDCLVFVQKS